MSEQHLADNEGASHGQSGELSSLLSEHEDQSAPSSSSSSSWSSVLSYACVLACVASLSIDYSVVMPSLFLFLRSVDPLVNEVWLGVSLAAFQLSSVLLSPLFGLWLIVMSRFVCGAGSTVGLASSLYIIRSTLPKDRSSAFAKVSGCQLLGLLCGPAFNYPLTQIPHVSLGPIVLTPLNSVGLFMALVLALDLALIHAFFREPLVASPVSEAPDEDEALSWQQRLRSIVTLGSVVLMGVSFVSSFNQVVLEMALPPILLRYWSFGQLQDSLVYMALTGYLMLWYLLLALVLTRRVQERVLMLAGWLFVAAGVLFLVVFFLVYGGWSEPSFGAGAFLVASSIPFFDSSTGALLSRMVLSPARQGRAQSLLSSVRGIGVLIGPLVGAPVLSAGPLWLFVLVGCAFVVAFPIFLVAFRHLVPLPAPAAVVIEEEEEKG